MDVVTEARAGKETIYGYASVSYCSQGGFSMKVTVPYGVIGEIRLPLDIKGVTINNLPAVGEKGARYVTYKVTGGEYAIKGVTK